MRRIKKGQADDHVGKVIPEGDGKQPHEKNLVGQNRGGGEEEKDSVTRGQRGVLFCLSWLDR